MKILKLLLILCIFSVIKINCSGLEGDSLGVISGICAQDLSKNLYNKNMVFSKDKRFCGFICDAECGGICSTCLFNLLYIFDNKNPNIIFSSRYSQSVRSFVFSEDSKFVFIEYRNGEKMIYDLIKKIEVVELSCYREYKNKLNFCNIDSFLNADFDYGKLVFYDAVNGISEIDKIGCFDNVSSFYFSNKFILRDYGNIIKSVAYTVIFFEDGSVKFLCMERIDSCDDYEKIYENVVTKKIFLKEVTEFKQITKK